jgi:hypothetical protein
MEPKIMYARGDKKGRLTLEDGRIAIPKDFIPREDWYLVEVEEERSHVVARLHKHTETPFGVCSTCFRVVNREKLEKFVEQWWNNMVRNKERIKEIGVTKGFLTSRIGDFIIDIGDMIHKLEQQRKKHLRSEFVCPPGYGVVDSCFVDRCIDKVCEQLEYIIDYLRYIRDHVLEERFKRVKQFVESDRIVTINTLGVETVRLI